MTQILQDTIGLSTVDRPPSPWSGLFLVLLCCLNTSVLLDGGSATRLKPADEIKIKERKRKRKNHSMRKICYKRHLEQRTNPYGALSISWRLVDWIHCLVELLKLLHPHPLALANPTARPADAEQEQVFSVWVVLEQLANVQCQGLPQASSLQGYTVRMTTTRGSSNSQRLPLPKCSVTNLLASSPDGRVRWWVSSSPNQGRVRELPGANDMVEDRKKVKKRLIE